MTHPAETYNRIRGIVFRTYHNSEKGGPEAAWRYLDGYRGELQETGYVGLKAELTFYERHKNDFGLTVAGDMGEHADFAGILSNQACRFDVTTTLHVKKWDTFEPYLGQGVGYKIALFKHDTFELVDILQLGFERCKCGGFLIPCVTLLRQNFNDKGESAWSNDQLLMDICTSCHEYIVRDRRSHMGMFSRQELVENLTGLFDNDEDRKAGRTVQSTAESQMLANYKYFRQEFHGRLMSVAQHEYTVTELDGGGHWAIQTVYVNPAVADEMPEEIECSYEL